MTKTLFVTRFAVVALSLGTVISPVWAQSIGVASDGSAIVSDATATPALGITSNDSRPLVSGPLALKEAVEFALKNSPVIRGAQAEIDAAQAQVDTARASRQPSLSTTTFATAGSESNPIYSTPTGVMPQNLFAVPRGLFLNQNLMLMMPLSTGGQLKALVKQAEAARAASAADFEAVQLDLALEIKTTYRQALLAQEMAKVARDRQLATAERLKNDQAAAEAGRVPELYVLRDRAEDADAEQEVTNADRDVEMALIMLRTAMGASPDSDFTLSENLQAPTDAPLTNALQVAREKRPELRAASNRLENARQGLAAARGNSRPQVALQAMADASRMEGGSGPGGGASVGVVVGIPLFDGGLRHAERQSASAEITRAQAELDKMQLQVEREVQLAQVSLKAAGKNLTLAQSSVDAAQETYRVATLRYEGGRGTNVEVLDALAALTRAKGNQAQALYQAEVASDQLSRALGE